MNEIQRGLQGRRFGHSQEQVEHRVRLMIAAFPEARVGHSNRRTALTMFPAHWNRACVSLLQDRLDEITANTRNLVQPERLEISEQAVAELYATGIEAKILPVGAAAPEFALADSSGRIVKSADLLALGPLILNFFRGRWCTYCVTELESWRELYASVRAKGGLLVAISPQTVWQNDFLSIQHALGFPVLSDPGCRVAKQFCLAYSLSPAQQRYYRGILVNIPFINGDESWQMPLPATYVLAPNGRVIFTEAHADFRVRPEPLEVLQALDRFPK